MNVNQVETTYISRKGQRLDINLAHPKLKGWLDSAALVAKLYCPTLEDKISGGLSFISTMKYDQVAQQAEYKPTLITATKMSHTAGLLFCSVPEGPEATSLGHLVYKDAMVCREKAMLTHLYLAELGIPTRYQPGTVKLDDHEADGHCWVEWIEPASARGETVEAVIDGTWGKIYTNYKYDEDFVVSKLKEKVYFEPIEQKDAADIAGALGRIAQKQAM